MVRGQLSNKHPLMCMHLKQSIKMCATKTIELLGEIDKFTVAVGYFNITLPVIDRSSRHQISKDIAELSIH